LSRAVYIGDFENREVGFCVYDCIYPVERKWRLKRMIGNELEPVVGEMAGCRSVQGWNIFAGFWVDGEQGSSGRKQRTSPPSEVKNNNRKTSVRALL
jgi:hypothetical protein